MNSRGESETYASDVFQNKLTNWFNTQIQEEARRLVLVASDTAPEPNQDQKCVNGEPRVDTNDQENNAPSPSPDILDDDDTIDWTDSHTRSDSRNSNPGSQLHAPFMQPALASIAEHQPFQQQNYHSIPQPKYPGQPNGLPELRRSISSPNPLSITNSNIETNKYFRHQHPPLPPRSHNNYNRPSPLNLQRSNSQSSLLGDGTVISPSGTEFKPLIIGNAEEVTTFLETRFRQLQQLCCKIVAKAWIKVIEPKKQTRYPYNRGEESKPEWWPNDVRHKEPDHLMKPGKSCSFGSFLL